MKPSLRPWPALLLAAGVLTAALTGASTAQPKKPNVLFILCDDLGYGDLGCFGSRTIKTQNLDRLADGGMKLTQFYAPSPVCSPSRAGFLTGRSPNRLGIRDWIPTNSGIYLHKEEVTAAELLKTAGYRTGHLGKWHLNSKFNGMEPTPGDHGFDYWFSTQNNAAPSHQNPDNFVRNGRRVGPLEGNSTTLIADEAIRFIRETRDQPFAAFVWFHAPHEPVATPEEYTRRYPGFTDPTQPVYYGSVSLVDHEVGRLLHTLEELKLRDNTLVLFTSDNGPETLKRYPSALHSHGSPGALKGMKLHVTEGGFREPAILSWPGHTQPGQVCKEPVSGLDLLPTLCEITGAPVPADRPLDGASFLPIFKNQPIRRKTPLYWQYDAAISKPWTLALREGRWKLLANQSINRFELYDLEADPNETRNLSEKHPDRVRTLAEKLRRLHQEINAPRAPE